MTRDLPALRQGDVLLITQNASGRHEDVAPCRWLGEVTYAAEYEARRYVTIRPLPHPQNPAGGYATTSQALDGGPLPGLYCWEDIEVVSTGDSASTVKGAGRGFLTVASPRADAVVRQYLGVLGPLEAVSNMGAMQRLALRAVANETASRRVEP